MGAIIVKALKILAWVYLLSVVLTEALDAQWVRTNGPYRGFGNPGIYPLFVSGPNLLAGAKGKLLISTDEGASWSYVVPIWIYNFCANGTKLYAAAGEGLYVSADNGATWSQITITGHFGASSIAVSGQTLFVGHYGGVLRSTDNGSTWSDASNGFTYPVVNALVVIDTSLLAGTNGGAVFRSTDNGMSWKQSNSGLTDPNVFAFAVIGTNVFAGTGGGGVFRSTNGGATWTQVINGLTNFIISSFAVNDTVLAVATQGGVFQSTDFGTTWSPVSAGFPSTNPIVWSVAFSKRYLFAGLYDGSGVWRYPLLGSAVGSPGEVPTSFSLSQNYPNPFNPKTTIEYTIGGTWDSGSGTTKTVLVVYDLLGRQVAELVNGENIPGSYKVTFSADGEGGNSLSSGVYVYRLTAGSSVLSRKMILLR
jgi:photosystem II stability/assembly factor-like uncharacterized protein